MTPRDLLFQIELLQLAQALLLRLPNTVDNVLDVENKVSLAVSGISEGHIRRIGLRDGCESQVRRPGLDEHHVAGNQAGSIRPAPGIRSTPKYNCSVIVGWIAKDLMELNGKSVEVSDVKRAKVVVECVVQKGIVNSEVDWLRPHVDSSRPLLSS